MCFSVEMFSKTETHTQYFPTLLWTLSNKPHDLGVCSSRLWIQYHRRWMMFGFRWRVTWSSITPRRMDTDLGLAAHISQQQARVIHDMNVRRWQPRLLSQTPRQVHNITLSGNDMNAPAWRVSCIIRVVSHIILLTYKIWLMYVRADIELDINICSIYCIHVTPNVVLFSMHMHFRVKRVAGVKDHFTCVIKCPSAFIYTYFDRIALVSMSTWPVELHIILGVGLSI